jgi:hypothetical protein
MIGCFCFQLLATEIEDKRGRSPIGPPTEQEERPLCRERWEAGRIDVIMANLHR